MSIAPANDEPSPERLIPRLPSQAVWARNSRPWKGDYELTWEWARENRLPFVALAAGAGLFAALTLLTMRLRSPEPAMFGVAVICLSMAFLLNRAHRQVRARREDEEFLENPKDSKSCLVEIEIRQDGLITGRDRGVAWIEDDALWFLGHRFDFCLGNQDLDSAGPFAAAQSFGGLHTMRLKYERRDVSLRIRPLLTSHDSPRLVTYEGSGAQGARFSQNLAEFIRNQPATKVPRKYPPLAIGPGARLFERIAPLAIVALITLPQLPQVFQRGEWVVALIWLMTPIAGALTFGWKWRAMRRIERSEGWFRPKPNAVPQRETAST